MRKKPKKSMKIERLDYKTVSIDFTLLHQFGLLDLKRQNVYRGTYRGCIFRYKYESKMGRVDSYVDYIALGLGSCNLIIVSGLSVRDLKGAVYLLY